MKAQEFIKVIRSLVHNHPYQAWAIIPTLERIFAWRPGKDRYTPTGLDKIDEEDSMLWSTPCLRTYYVSQNKAFYELLYKKCPELVNRTLDLIKTQQEDNQSTHESMSVKNDGVSSCAWILHYHTQHHMDRDDEYQDMFYYMWSWFKSGSLPKVTQKVRNELPRAREMKLKLKYDRTIMKWAGEVMGRGPRFINPMTVWLKVPDNAHRHDALRYISHFLGEVDHIFATCNQSAITTSTTRHSQRAQRTLDILMDATARFGQDRGRGGRDGGRGRPRDGPRGRPRGGGRGRGGPGRGARRSPKKNGSRDGKRQDTGPQVKCMGKPHGKRCNNTLPTGMRDKLSANGVKTTVVICRECFNIMMKEGKVECVDGKWRHKLTKGTGDVCRFVHVYISSGFAKETIRTVLQAHAKASRKVTQPRKKKVTTKTDTVIEAAKIIK